MKKDKPHLPVFLVPLSYAAAPSDCPESTKGDSAAVVSLLKQIKSYASSSENTELKSPATPEPGRKSGTDVITQCTNDLHRLLFRRPSCSMSITNLDLISKASSGAASGAAAPSGGVHVRFVRLLLKKATGTFSILVSALRSDRVGQNPCSVASLLTLLYNLLKCLPVTHVSRAVHACERYNLSRACGAVLHSIEPMQTYAPGDPVKKAILRSAEAASLLYAVAGLYNRKVLLMARLSKDLGALTSVLDSFGSLLQASLSKHSLPGTTSEEVTLPSVPLKEVKALYSPLLRCVVHTSVSLFSLAKGANNAQELGVHFAGTCAQRVDFFCGAIDAIKKRAPSLSSGPSDCLVWLTEWLKQLRTACFWQLALFHRVCSCPAIRSKAAEEATHHRFVGRCEHILTESCSFSIPRAAAAEPSGLSHSIATTNYHLEFTHMVLLCLAEMLAGNRTATLEELDKVGGLRHIVDLLLTCKEPKASLWQQFFMRTAGLYGVSALPAPAGQDGCALDQRRPQRPGYGVVGLSKGEKGDGAVVSEPELLPIDINADVFSPELRGAAGSVNGALPRPLPPLEEIQLPHHFTSVPAPPTALLYAKGRSAQREEGDYAPLAEPTEDERVEVLRRQLSRFCLLDERCHDGVKGQEHVYPIVYERGVLTRDDGCRFDSDFECGNLKRAVKVTEREYDLVLSWDTTTNSFTQWFYFSIENYVCGATYRFNILNMEKGGSTFNEGQRPLMYHLKERAASPPEGANWHRVGSKIYYFRNRYARPERARFADAAKPKASKGAGNEEGTKVKGAKSKSKKATKATTTARPPLFTQYFTLSFDVTMPSEGGIVYLCNCYPYAYTELCTYLRDLEVQASATYKLSPLLVQSLCESLGGLPVPLLTLTARFNEERNGPYTEEEVAARPVCVLDARVHPGETNSSWVMQGVLEALLTPHSAAAKDLLTSYVFKVIPMINVDGVVMGNHRCSFAGTDLNRDYLHPSPEDNPVIYSMKQLVRHMLQVQGRRVVMYADFHGHSREQDFFVYGCTQETIKALEKKVGAAEGSSGGAELAGMSPEKFFPMLLRLICPTFSLPRSSFAVQKSKRGSARVVMYKEMGIPMSFGFEGTMMGGSASSFYGEASEPYEVVPRELYKGCSHYCQRNYLTFGGCFVKALHLFSLHDREVLQWKEAGTGGPLHSVAQRAWSLVREAGTGKLATGEGAERKPEVTSVSSSQDVVAGPYVLATRSDRRCGSGVAASEEPPESVASKAAMLEYLMRRGQESLLIEREDLSPDGEEDGEEDDPDDWLTYARKEQQVEGESESVDGNILDASAPDNADDSSSSSAASDVDEIADDDLVGGEVVVFLNDTDDFFENSLPTNVLLL